MSLISNLTQFYLCDIKLDNFVVKLLRHWQFSKCSLVSVISMQHVTLLCLRTLHASRTVGHVWLGFHCSLLTVKSNIWKVGIIFTFFVTVMIIFSAAICDPKYANSHSYPNGTVCSWWANVTITTMGYGDTCVYRTTLPITPLGQHVCHGYILWFTNNPSHCSKWQPDAE